MSIVQNAPDTDQHALQKWCEEVAALHAELTKPINVSSDARLVELISTKPHVARSLWEPQALADMYFAHCVELPAWPLPAPEWTVGTSVEIGTYPEFQVTHWGTSWEQGNQSVRLEHFMVATVEDEYYGDGELLNAAGTLTDHGMSIHCGNDDLTVTEADDLSAVLCSVVAEIRSYSEGSI